MISKITLLIGLPGAGKTTFGNTLLNSNTLFLDDINIITQNQKSNLMLLLNEVKQNKLIEHLIISDVFLCNQPTLDKCLEILEQTIPEAIIEPVFFENDLIACLNNIENRKANGDNRQVTQLTKQLSSQYIIPKNSNIRKIKN